MPLRQALESGGSGWRSSPNFSTLMPAAVG